MVAEKGAERGHGREQNTQKNEKASVSTAVVAIGIHESLPTLLKVQ